LVTVRIVLRMRTSGNSSHRIEAAAEESFEVVPGRADAGLVVICDHAGNAFPPGYGTLGLPADQLQRHIAYDIGAAAIARAVAAALDAPAVLSRFSRLLIDPNRGADDPTLIMRLSDGAVVPGNRHLDSAERDKRFKLYYEPYHRAIDVVIDRCLDCGVPPALLSIHSFTESWKGVSRPWHIGVLWDKDARLAKPLLAHFEAEGTLIVGDNQPYSGKLEGDCMWQHGTMRGLAHAIVEVRQDLIRDATGQMAWARRLIEIVEKLRLRADLHLNVVQRRDAIAPATSSLPHGVSPMSKLDARTETELQAAAFRRLVDHLGQRPDVQNIDLMNLAGFCRNCLANWYQEAANAQGHALTKDEARETIYGMPYKEWQAKHQTDASPEQKTAFARASKPHEH
jgi:predicted N-formylglutamate amidohydrolase